MKNLLILVFVLAAIFIVGMIYIGGTLQVLRPCNVEYRPVTLIPQQGSIISTEDASQALKSVVTNYPGKLSFEDQVIQRTSNDLVYREIPTLFFDPESGIPKTRDIFAWVLLSGTHIGTAIDGNGTLYQYTGCL